MSIQGEIVLIFAVCLFSSFIQSSLGGKEEDFEEAPWTASKSRCNYRVEFLNSVSKFLKFAKELDMPSGKDQQQTTKMINDCLRSADGEGDIRALAEIVEQFPTIHSVCETEFIDKLYYFIKRITDNGTQGLFKRKSAHALLRFSTLFTGQVILTCKRNLEAKLEQAEQSDEELRQSLDLVENDKIIRPTVESVLPNSQVDLPENISTAVAKKIKNREDAYGFLVTETDEIAEQFVKIRKACWLIDSYAQGSIYPIVGFAIVGFTVGDDDDITDNKLKSSPRVARWLNAVQYCQAVTLIIGVPGAENSESLASAVSSEELNKQLEAKSFETADKFDDIGWDLQCTLQSPESKSKGIKDWIKKGVDKFHKKF